MIPRVTLYTRSGCCLCEDARRELARAGLGAEFELEIVDIDASAELRALYNDEVPVIAINGRKAFKYRVEAGDFLRRLEARS